MYNKLSLQNLYNNDNSSKSFKLKYFNKHHRTLISNKLDKINKLDRAILNQQMKVNECLLGEKCEVDDKKMSIQKLSSLKDLKSKWEKELLYMYFEEI